MSSVLALSGCQGDPYAAPARELGVHLEKAAALGMPEDPAEFAPRPVKPEEDLGPFVADYRGNMAQHRPLMLELVNANMRLRPFGQWDTVRKEILPRYNTIAGKSGIGLSYDWSRAFLADFAELPILLLIRGDLYDLAIAATLAGQAEVAITLERHLLSVNRILARYPQAMGYLQAVTSESLRIDLLVMMLERLPSGAARKHVEKALNDSAVDFEDLKRISLNEMYFTRSYLRQLEPEEVETAASADAEKRKAIIQRPAKTSDPTDLRRQAWLSKALEAALVLHETLQSKERPHERFNHLRKYRESITAQTDPSYLVAKSDQIADLTYYFLRLEAQRASARLLLTGPVDASEALDPFSDQPLVYRKNDRATYAYSVGPDGEDEDGPTPGISDDIGFRIPREKQGAAPVPRLENPLNRARAGAANSAPSPSQ